MELSHEKHMRSLFIVALPRSLSAVIYHAARAALGLDETAWTSEGEILNNDRFSLYGGARHDSGMKYVSPILEPRSFHAVIAFLDDVIRREGRVYKDVVHPFAVSAWLPTSGLRVLRLRRCVEDVAFAMRLQGWTYPARAASLDSDDRTMPTLETAIIDGLLRAEQALQALPGEVVDYDSLIEDEDVLRDALSRLYPAARLREVRYIDDGFCWKRDAALARKRWSAYRELAALVHRRRAMLAAHA